jgi:hypothetical protein
MFIEAETITKYKFEVYIGQTKAGRIKNVVSITPTCDVIFIDDLKTSGCIDVKTTCIRHVRSKRHCSITFRLKTTILMKIPSF